MSNAKKKGTQTIKQGDSIAFAFVIWDIVSSNLILEYPPETTTKRIFAFFTAPQDINQGQTYDIDMSTVIDGSLGSTREIGLSIRTYLLNRTNPIHDDDSINNQNISNLFWYDDTKASIGELSYNSDNIAVYPNPANDKLNVSLLFAESNAVNIELIDLTGKAVASPNMNQAISPNQYTLDVADLSKGVYILKVTNGTKVSTSKVTISH